MKSIKKTTLLTGLVVVAAMALMAFGPMHSNGMAGYAGSPSEGNCTSCHGGNTLNQGGGSLTITNNIPASGYVLGTTYQVTVTVSQPNITLFGFGLEALNTSNTNAGTLAAVSGGGAQILSAGNGRTNATHTSSGGVSTSGSKSFVVNWTAPTTNVGTVTFYASGNAANADGGSSGDFIYTTTKTASAASTGLTVAITGDASVCVGSCAIETASVTGGTSTYTYAWSNSTPSAVNTVCPTGTTTYTVTATSANGQTGTASKTVTVKTPTPVTITAPTTFCPSNSITVTASQGFASYAWSTGATTASITNTPTSTMTYTVTATGTNGCTATASKTVTMGSFANATVTTVGNLCGPNGATITAAGGGTYLWSTGATTAAITVTAASVYLVTVTNATGCTASTGAAISACTGLSVSISGDSAVCAGKCIPLVATATGGGTGVTYTYLWSTQAQDPTIQACLTGTTTYTVVATSSTGSTGSATKTVSVRLPTNISITGNTAICAGKPTTLAAAPVTGGTTGLTFAWGPSGGLSGTTGATVTATVTANNTYTVTATNAVGCTSTASKSLVVTLPPVPTITQTGTPCSPNGASLTAATNGATGSTFVWSNGSTVATTSVLQAGTYTVTATNSGGCTGTATVIVAACTNNGVSISGDSSTCAGTCKPLLATATGGVAGTTFTYTWSTGATTASIQPCPTGTTTYTVYATGSNGTTVSATKTITVHLPSPVTIAGGGATCAGKPSTLTASVSGGIANPTFSWGLAGGLNTTVGATVIATVTAATTYTVTATNVYGCTSTATKSITVTLPPVPTITKTGSVCAPNAAILTAATAGTASSAFAWSNGGTTAAITVQQAGTYTVTATNSSGCTGTTSVVVEPCATLNVTIASITPICVGSCITLTAAATSTVAGATYTYAWSSVTTPPTGATLQVCPTGNTTYTVTATSSAGGTATASVMVEVVAKPTVTITKTGSLCSPNGITLTPSATGTGTLTYIWSMGGGTTLLVQQAGTYTVTATNAYGCSGTASITIGAAVPPTVTITTPNVITCANPTATFTASGGVSYVWNDSTTNPTKTVTSVGTYTVTVTNADGCMATKSVTVTLNTEHPVPIVTKTGSLCNTSGVTLTATATGVGATLPLTFAWSSGSTTADAVVHQGGVYTVTVTNGNGCTATANATVVNGTPIAATISGTPTLCQGSFEVLTVSATPTTSAPFTYSWGAVSSSASLTIQTVGTYSATVTNASGCTATASFVVTGKSAPVPTIVGATTACGAVKLTAGGGANYIWSGGNTPLLALNTFFNSGTYAVYVTNSDGCTASKTVTVTILPQAACSNPRTTGTDNADEVEVTMVLYPNPANDHISLQTNLTGAATLNVYNQTGQLVQSLTSVVIANGYTLPISGYANGVYILEMKTDDGAHLYRKFVKSE